MRVTSEAQLPRRWRRGDAMRRFQLQRARRIRRRGSAGPAIGAAMAAYDEAMHATAHQRFVEVQAQRDRSHERPAPGERST